MGQARQLLWASAGSRREPEESIDGAAAGAPTSDPRGPRAASARRRAPAAAPLHASCLPVTDTPGARAGFCGFQKRMRQVPSGPGARGTRSGRVFRVCPCRGPFPAAQPPWVPVTSRHCQHGRPGLGMQRKANPALILTFVAARRDSDRIAIKKRE